MNNTTLMHMKNIVRQQPNCLHTECYFTSNTSFFRNWTKSSLNKTWAWWDWIEVVTIRKYWVTSPGCPTTVWSMAHRSGPDEFVLLGHSLMSQLNVLTTGEKDVCRLQGGYTQNVPDVNLRDLTGPAFSKKCSAKIKLNPILLPGHCFGVEIYVTMPQHHTCNHVKKAVFTVTTVAWQKVSASA